MGNKLVPQTSHESRMLLTGLQNTSLASQLLKNASNCTKFFKCSKCWLLDQRKSTVAYLQPDQALAYLS